MISSQKLKGLFAMLLNLFLDVSWFGVLLVHTIKIRGLDLFSGSLFQYFFAGQFLLPHAKKQNID